MMKLNTADAGRQQGGDSGGPQYSMGLPPPPSTQHQPNNANSWSVKKERAEVAAVGPGGKAKDAGSQYSTEDAMDDVLDVDMPVETAPAHVGARPTRDTRQRPLYKLSVNLIETYKSINTLYYDKKQKRQQALAAQQQQQQQPQQPAPGKNLQAKTQATAAGPLSSVSSTSSASASTSTTASSAKGVYNNGWDDEHYDYLFEKDELVNDRYELKQRIGKGSFGQVLRGYDRVAGVEVAIKIIKSRRPFMMQAKTEIELLELLKEKDRADEHNLVRLLDHFIYRGHQCIIFEMLSYNLYDLLKYTKFHGVSLTLLRKFAKQILRALQFLSHRDVDIIHCDLKPENILLRHPKRSGIKVIDFGSSCRSNKRMYSYIQSRFYRSPEVMLGLSYSVAIDMWSLGCVLAEMHTGEPLFGGVDQVDQMRRLVEVLGVPPSAMLEQSPPASRDTFFEVASPALGHRPQTWRFKNSSASSARAPGGRQLSDILGVNTGGPGGRRAGETGHSLYHYNTFLDLVNQMLHYDPAARITPAEALRHPFIVESETQPIPRAIAGQVYEQQVKDEALRSPRAAHADMHGRTKA